MFLKNTKHYILLIIFIVGFQTLSALEYGIYAKREGFRKINKLSLYGERCSGSNYTRALITNNTQLRNTPLGHKHFPPWFDLSIDEWHGDPQCYTFRKTDNRLFVIVFRNPYDWARSLMKTPWHADSSLLHLSFSDFIRAPWILNPEDPVIMKQMKFNPLVDRDPFSGACFNNIFELRSAKIRNMLQIINKVKNIYVVNYETVRDHPHEVLNEISKIFRIQLNKKFKPVDNYKGDPNQGKYEDKNYPLPSTSDLEWINSQLDLDLEEQIGYPLTLIE